MVGERPSAVYFAFGSCFGCSLGNLDSDPFPKENRQIQTFLGCIGEAMALALHSCRLGKLQHATRLWFILLIQKDPKKGDCLQRERSDSELWRVNLSTSAVDRL